MSAISERIRKAPPRRRSKAKELAALKFDLLPTLLGFHVRLANIAMLRDFMETVRELDLTQRQSAILMLIGENPGTSQIVLAEFLSTDRATMMAMVDKLESRGLVSRQASLNDRRVRNLHLTADGKRTLAGLLQKIVLHEKHFKGRFSDRELKLFTEFLGRVHQKF